MDQSIWTKSEFCNQYCQQGNQFWTVRRLLAQRRQRGKPATRRRRLLHFTIHSFIMPPLHEHQDHLNRPRRSYNRPSLVQRRAAIDRFWQGDSAAEISRQTQIPRSTVNHIIQRFEDDGEVGPQRRGGPRRPPSLSTEQKRFLQDLFDDEIVPTLEEAKEKLVSQYPCASSVSRSTISRAIPRNGYTITRCYLESQDRNSPEKKAQRAQWCDRHLLDEYWRDCIFIDQADFNLHTKRQRGRPPTGHRAVVEVPRSNGPNVTLMVAASARSGVLAAKCFWTSRHRHTLYDFISESVYPLLDQGKTHTFVMDNIHFRHANEMQDLIINKGDRPICLPPCSPNFNIAEWVFAAAKTPVSKRDMRNQDELTETIEKHILRINEVRCQGWLRTANKWMVAAYSGHDLGELHEPPPDTTAAADPEH